jgi:class 3 adenylate cyclase
MLGGRPVGCHTSLVLATRTFLFSDLRDYTRFVEKHGDEAARTLIQDYRRIVRAEIAKHEGAEVKTEGDSFYVVFTNARAAVACASAILREAAAYSKERPARPMEIGAGIHAGEPVPHEGQYVGSAVIVAARLAQQAAAGELLVSEVVRALLPKTEAPRMSEREGLVLKGIAEPPRVFSVTWRGGASRGVATPEVAIEAAEPLSRQVLCPIVVGRDAELGVLTAALADAASGRARTILVSGEAGLGKSALLRRFREAATAAGARVLVGECSEVEARRPFGPFIDALSGAAIPLPTDLSQGGPGAEPIGEAERYRVHQGFAERIVQTARDAPLVLAIEDLHWADEATYELVPYLARKLRDARVLLLATYRSDELHRLHPLNHVLAELARGRLVEDVRLHKLSLEETGTVLRAAMGLNRPPTTAFRQAIWDRTEGNPFFIEEILRALIEKGELAYRDGAWRRTKEVADLAIPVSVRDAVQQHLLAMEPTARKVIQIAAVIGPRFEFDLLAEVSGVGEQQVLDAIKSAIDQQLVREEVDAADDAYAFRHALSRESVLGELLQRERRLLHRAVGEAIERRTGGSGRAEDLAYHFDQARDAAKAYRYHQAAAAEAERVFAFARALGHLERAAELADDDDPQLGDLELRLGSVASNAGDAARADRAAAEARAFYAARNDERGLAVAMRQHSLYRWTLGDTEGARDLGREAVSRLEPLGKTGDLASAYGTVARHAMLAGDDRDAIAFGQRALALARETGERDAEVHALITVGTTRANIGDDDGVAQIREGIALAERYGFVDAAQRGYQNLVVSLLLRHGSDAERRRVHEEARAHARRYGVRPTNQLNREVIFAFSDGNWDAAIRIAEDEQDDTIWSAAREMTAALIIAAREGPEHALQRMDGPWRRLVAARDPQWAIVATAGAAIPYLGGDPRRALELCEPLVPLFDLPVLPFPRVCEPAVVIALLAAHGREDPAALERWAALAAGRRSDDKVVMIPDVADALRRARDGSSQNAAATMAAALEQFGGDGMDVGLALLREFAAKLFATAGDPARAATMIAPVVHWLRRGDGQWYLRRIETWAAERGVTLPD